MCVCVCVSVSVFFPTNQGETCTSICSVFRGLHLAAYFSILLNQPGVTQDQG